MMKTDLSYSMIIDKNVKEKYSKKINIKCIPVIPRRMNYWVDEKFITKRILLSKLREAPIIGMGAKVWMEYC